MSKDAHTFLSVFRSGFVRSVFLRVLSIFIVISIAIAAIAFYSFASEIRKNKLSDRVKQLSAAEDTISKRMEEITSIAYNIGQDSTFFIEPMENESFSGYQMSNTLARYLVGNRFIKHLAYYRLSEPDKIYISSGERSLSEFFITSFGFDEATAKEYIRNIQSVTKTQIMLLTYDKEENSFFSYLYPLPQLSKNPQAYVMMLIPIKEVSSLFDKLSLSTAGDIAVFDADGNPIFRSSRLEEALPPGRLRAKRRAGGSTQVRLRQQIRSAEGGFRKQRLDLRIRDSAKRYLIRTGQQTTGIYPAFAAGSVRGDHRDAF